MPQNQKVRHLRNESKPRDMCETCRLGRGPCTHEKATLYGNCYNRQHCELLEGALVSEVLQDILDSNCLSCNYTTQARLIVEKHLRQFIVFMRPDDAS